MAVDRPLRVGQALEIVPDLESLLPLRNAMIERSRIDPDRKWSPAEAYSLLDTRSLGLEELTEQLPAIVEEVRARTERTYKSIIRSLHLIGAGDLAGAATALVSAGEDEERAGHLDAAEQLYGRARDLGRRPKERVAEALALRRLARLARRRGRLADALDLYRESYAIADAIGDMDARIIACQGIGNVYGDQERWSEAESAYHEGIELHHPPLAARLLWELQGNLSVTARNRGALAESRHWLEQAEQTAATSQDGTSNVYLQNAAALLCAAEGDLVRAESIYRSSLADDTGPAERATLLINLAKCLAAQGRFEEVTAVCREVEELVMVNRLVGFLPHVYRTLGSVAAARRDEDGFIFFEQALELARAPGVAPHEEALTERDYATYEADLGRFDAAIARLQAAESIFRRLGIVSRADAVAAELHTLNERPDRIRERPLHQDEK